MGDSSRCSSAIKDCQDQEPEESGWTSYFEDFEMMNQREKNNIGSSYSYCSGTTRSIVSGGASTACKMINLRKKSRADQVSDFDDSLEDTATSPLSSPKMGSLMHTKMKPRSGRYDNTGSPLGKGGYFHQEEEAAGKEGHGNYMMSSNNNIDDHDEYADLQRRGLCLVPFSMFANYTG